MRALVIEDERRLADNIACGLRQTGGFAVDLAFDGKDGLFMFEEGGYDVIVLDLMLPFVSGEDFLLSIRGRGSRTPVLVLTAKEGKTHLQNKMLHARMVGVTEEFENIRNLHISSGRYFDREGFSAHFKVRLFSDMLAIKSFGIKNTVGKTANVDQLSCTVIGTFNEGVPTFGQSEIQDETVLIPFNLVKAITGDNFFQVLYVQASSHTDIPYLTSQLDQVLHTRHRSQAHYFVENLSSLVGTANKIARAITALLVGIAAITLTIAGTGIMNIMMLNVSERTREIGLRKAISATAFQIRLQFLLEALFISLGGAAIGVALALFLIWSISLSFGSMGPLNISWGAVLLAFLASSGIGIVFGYRPATQAAKLDPIQALHTE